MLILLSDIWRLSKSRDSFGTEGFRRDWNKHLSLSLFFFFVVLGIEPRGVLPPRYTPALFFILYFETGSHEVVEGLTK